MMLKPTLLITLILSICHIGSAQKCFTSNHELLTAIKIYIQAKDGEFNQVAFDQLSQTYGSPIGSWCTSQMTNFSSIFSVEEHFDYVEEIKAFNEDISGWNTSMATDMSFMFFGAESFNKNIASWNTGQVVTFESMFSGARAFNQPIGSWNTLAAQSFQDMFNSAIAFNQNLNGWNTPNLVKLASMFNDAKAFNGDISSWDVSQVGDFSSLFYGANNFNSNIGNWQMQNAGNLQRMFMQATAFNQNIGSWQTGKVSDFLHLFDSAESFNQDIGNWDTSQVTNMANCFRGAKSFNQDISGWDMSKVSKHDKMFDGAQAFNQNLCPWKDNFQYSQVGNLFTDTNCIFEENPDPILKGPFCGDSCGNMMLPGTSAPTPMNDGGTDSGGGGGAIPVPTRFPTLAPVGPPVIMPVSRPSGSSRVPTLPPGSKIPTPPLPARQPLSDKAKSLIFGIGGAVILAIVAVSTACCGEPAGSKQFELEMEEMSPDPNALPSDQYVEEDDANYDDSAGYYDDYDEDESSESSNTSPDLV